MPPRSTRIGAPTSWRLSLTTSLILHAGVVLAFVVASAPPTPRGGDRRPVAAVVFDLFPDRPEVLSDPPAEEERDLEVALLEEPVEVRPVAYEPEPIPPEMPLERVELLPRPTDGLRPEDLTPPAPKPVAAPEELLPQPIPEPAPPVDPPLDEEEVQETVGEADASEVVPAPLADACPDPAYPQRAIVRRLTGAVECRITVGTDGRVRAVTVVKSSGHAILDRAARDGLLAWRFRPGTRGGVAVEMDVLKTILFRVP